MCCCGQPEISTCPERIFRVTALLSHELSSVCLNEWLQLYAKISIELATYTTIFRESISYLPGKHQLSSGKASAIFQESISYLPGKHKLSSVRVDLDKHPAVVKSQYICDHTSKSHRSFYFLVLCSCNFILLLFDKLLEHISPVFCSWQGWRTGSEKNFCPFFRWFRTL